MGPGAGCSSVGLAAGAGQPRTHRRCGLRAESPRAAGETGPGGAGTAAETCCHLPLLCPDPNLTPLPSSAPLLQPGPSSFNCSHFVSRPPAAVGVPDALPRVFYRTLLVQPLAPPTTCKASPNSLFCFGWGPVSAGCLGKII